MNLDGRTNQINFAWDLTHFSICQNYLVNFLTKNSKMKLSREFSTVFYTLWSAFFSCHPSLLRSEKRNKSCQFIPRNDPRAFVSLTKLKVKKMRQYHNHNSPNHCYTTRLYCHHHHHLLLLLHHHHNHYRTVVIEQKGVTSRKPLRQKPVCWCKFGARFWHRYTLLTLNKTF